MSELYWFHIEAVEGAEARIRVETLQDIGEIPRSNAFALWIVLDAFDRIDSAHDMGLEEGERPLYRLAAGHPLRADLHRWQTMILPEDEDGALTPAQRARAFVDLANAEVTSVGAEGDRELEPSEEDDDPCREVTLVVRVARPSVLSHLRTGMEWASAIHDPADHTA